MYFEFSGAVCPDGQYTLPDSSCDACPLNSYCQGGEAILCPGNSTSGVGSTSLLQCMCADGFFRDAQYQCPSCPAGFSCSGNLKTACAAGSYSGLEQSSCTPCGLGTYEPIAGASQCQTCPAGPEVLRISTATEFDAPISRSHVDPVTNKLYIFRNFLTTSQGNNITKWSFYATKAGCAVTPAIFRADANGNNLDGNIWFSLHQLGTKRITSSSGAFTFDFMEGAEYPVRVPVSTGTPYVYSYEFFGWIFDGDVCIPYDYGDVSTSFFVMPFDYDPLVPDYFMSGSVYSPSQYWSVQVSYQWGNVVPSTQAVGASAITQCMCPSEFRQISDGSCQALCPSGKYMVHETDTVCSTCPQGYYCTESVATACPLGQSAAPGSSVCSPCPGPGTNTDIALNLCGLLTCPAATPVRLGTSNWFGLGQIRIGAGGTSGIPSTPWFPGSSVAGLVLNSASDRPHAMIQRAFDVTPDAPIAIQFRVLCSGASCASSLAVQWSADSVHFSPIFTASSVQTGNWIQTSTQFITPNTTRVTLRFVAQMIPLSSIVWISGVEVVTPGQWTYDNVANAKLTNTVNILIPYSDTYSSLVEMSAIQLSGAQFSETVPSNLVYTGGYQYLAAVWVTGSGNLTIKTSATASQLYQVDTAPNAWQQLVFTTNVPPTEFTLASSGSVTVSGLSLTLRSLTIGPQTCLSNYWCANQHIYNCPDHSHSLAGSSAQTDCYCDAGYYGRLGHPTGYTPCSVCDVNHFCTGGNSMEVCPNGTKSVAGSSVCTTCAANEICQGGRVDGCPLHSHSPSGSDGIEDCVCDDGYYGTAPNCQYCLPGHYCQGGQSIACTQHATSPNGAPVASSCFCDRGYYGVSNEPCTACEEGSWCWTGVKNVCPTHMWSPVTSSFSSNCTCEFGYQRSGADSCVPCGTGTYKPSRGEDVCTNCPAGTSSSATGATSAATCSVCDTGKFSDVPGQYQCQNCAAGYYQPGLGSTGCLSCWEGSYSLAGAAHCSPCSAGSMSAVVAAPSSSVCVACPVGSWSSGNSSACNICGACPYWSYPRTVFFYVLDLFHIISDPASISMRFAVYNGQTIMSQFKTLSYINPVTGATLGVITTQIPGVGGVYSSLAPSTRGNFLYAVQGLYVYRIDMDMGAWDTVYPSSLATCVVEDGNVIWIAQSDGVRALDSVSTAVSKNFAITGSNYVCLHDAHPNDLFVTGTYGLKRVNKQTGASSILDSSNGPYTTCRFTPDGNFIILSQTTAKQAWSYSIFDGRLVKILNNAIVTDMLTYNSTITFAVQAVGVSSVVYDFKDSASCSPGKFSAYSGLQLESQCDVCPAGSLCPGGRNITQCAPGTYSLVTGNREQAQCQTCPPGYYCVGGNGFTTCPLGTYSPNSAVSSIADCPSCAAGYFCPNTTTQVVCPPNTNSIAGASDLGECVCSAGYKCVVVKVVHAEIVLPIAASAFDDAMRAQYIQALALAAGVSVNDVHIVSVQQVSLSGGRRLLEFGADAIEIHTSIYKAQREDIADLNAHLMSHGLPAHRGIKVTIHSEIVNTIRV